MKILITGGAGFIGSHIADAFLNSGNEVFIIDNLSTGKETNIPKEAKFYKEDICSEETTKIIKSEKFDVIDHHAAQVSVSRSVREPKFDAQVNIIGTINLLTAAAESGVKKFIFSSSGGTIYGEVKGEPANESFAPCPISPYGIAKLAGEYYIKIICNQAGMKYTILRYANVYGPRQDPHGEAGVVAIFSKAMLAGRSPTIFGDGGCIRDYVYGPDLARANLLSLTAGDNAIVNIGSQTTTDVNQLATLLKNITNFQGEILYGEPRAGDIQRSVLNIGKAKIILNWEPQISLAEGCALTVEYFKNNEH